MAVIIIDKCSCHSQRFYPCQTSMRSYFHNCFYSYVKDWVLCECSKSLMYFAFDSTVRTGRATSYVHPGVPRESNA